MLISQLIEKLNRAHDEHGDHPLTTFDGFIDDVDIEPAKDGISYPIKEGSHNELSIEFTIKWGD